MFLLFMDGLLKILSYKPEIFFLRTILILQILH